VNDVPDSEYIVKPVYRALTLLQAVGEAGRDLTLGEVSTLTGIPKTTAFKYLRTLCSRGFLEHDRDRDRYRPGLTLWRLGQLSDEREAIRQVATPFVRKLRDRFEETVNLGILDGREIIYLDVAESRRSLRMQAAIGQRDTTYSTGLGKAILAFLGDDQWRQHLPEQLIARTANTVTSVEDLEAELGKVRGHGYAVDRCENEEGLICIAAPILARDARVAAALSVSMPMSRCTNSLQHQVVDALAEATGSASQKLGFVPTP
jgi:DNA-binding IclR family transcriptional regulator